MYGGEKMIAVQGLYENGKIELAEKAPVNRANVIVIFPESPAGKEEMRLESARRLFDEFTGSISREINEKEEYLEALDEKYAYSD